MATYLYRIGRWSYDRRRTVLAGWLAVLVAVGVLAATFGGTKNNKFEVPGTESQQAQELLEARYPAASGTYARVVFAAPEGETLKDASNAAAVDATLKEAAGAAEVSQVSQVTLSKDGTIGYADIVYPVPSSEVSDEAREELADIAGTGVANPVGAVWSAALMLGHLGHPDAAADVLAAMEATLAKAETRTADLGGSASTSQVTEALVGHLR